MRNNRGQAMAEMVVVIPLLLMLAGGVASVIYMCLQGVKVQQAANLAARIQGQERVAGGASLSSIQQDNGTASTNGDIDPTLDTTQLNMDRVNVLRATPRAQMSNNTVYGKIQLAVRSLFGLSEQQDLFIPMPTYGSVGYSDQVKVVRLVAPPQIFGMTVDPIAVSATAYGGEDPHMFGLVRWGTANTNATSTDQRFWSDPSNLSGKD